MRQITIITSCLILAMCSCRRASGKISRSFLPGIYVSWSQNEFCRIEDTLTVRKVNLDSNGYTIFRASGFTQLRGVRRVQCEHLTDEWRAIFDPNLGALESVGNGKNIRYLESENCLLLDHWAYEKVE